MTDTDSLVLHIQRRQRADGTYERWEERLVESGMQDEMGSSLLLTFFIVSSVGFTCDARTAQPQLREETEDSNISIACSALQKPQRRPVVVIRPAVRSCAFTLLGGSVVLRMKQTGICVYTDV
jgi:hypothetical protein